MTEQGADPADRFIPVRKDDIIQGLLGQGALASEAERERFGLLCRMLAAILHYEYFAQLERLRQDYYYFGPETSPHAAMKPAEVERAYADLVESVDRVLKDANFTELPHRDISDAHRRRTVLNVEVKASLGDFREVRFYRRGHHREQFEVPEWFGLRRRKIDAEVYDDVVLLVAMKPQAELSSREQRTLERRKIRPGSVLLKYFRNIAAADLQSLFPNVRVVMSNLDKLMLGVPAIAGGIPILLNLYATITVLFVVVGFYLGFNAVLRDTDLKTALAALGGLVALGGFVARQWVKYQRQSLKYRTELADNVYYRNVNNNAGIFDSLIGAAEDQECKEALLAYYFLNAAPGPSDARGLAARVGGWLRDSFGVDVDFDVDDPVARLEGLDLVKRDGGRLFVSPPERAIAQLQEAWDRFFPAEPGTPTA